MIETERLVLKSYSDSDRDSMAEILTNEEIKKTYMIPNFKSEDEVTKMFYKLKELSLSDKHYVRGIYAQDKLIGFINDVDIDDGVIELGYVIHPSYQHKGYCTEALKAAIEDLFKKGYREVQAAAFEENEASFSVMKKAGMTPIEKADDITYHGKLHHCRYYAIKKTNKMKISYTV